MKKIVLVILILILIIGAFLLRISKDNLIDNNNKKECKIEIIMHDYMDDSDKIVYEEKVKVNDVVDMSKYSLRNGWNDIKILEINEENVKISREAIKYEIIEVGKSKKYNETIKEFIEYGKEVSANINQDDPYGPEYASPLFHYTVKFVK